jgi:hypothetical protein
MGGSSRSAPGTDISMGSSGCHCQMARRTAGSPSALRPSGGRHAYQRLPATGKLLSLFQGILILFFANQKCLPSFRQARGHARTSVTAGSNLRSASNRRPAIQTRRSPDRQRTR